MNLLKIEMKNVGNHAKAVVDFVKHGLYCIIGKTGAGKTSIIDTFSYALYGETPKGSADDLIKTGTSKMSATTYFKAQGACYKVVRKRVRDKSTSLKLYKKGKGNITASTIKETQALINRITGLDYNLYRSSICFEQGASNSFSILTPAKAKEILAQLLCLDVYERCHEIAKGKEGNLAFDRIEKTTHRNLFEGQLEELAKLKGIKKKLEIKTNELNRVSHVSAKLEQILKDLLKQQDTKTEEYHNIGTQISLKNHTMKELKSKMLKLKAAKNECPLCNSVLGKEGKTRAIGHILSELQAVDKELRQLIPEASKFQTQLEKIAKTIEVGENKHNIIFTAQNALEKSIIILNTKKLQKGKDITKLKLKLTMTKKRLVQIASGIEKYTSLARAFGKNGIQTHIINKILPEIEYVSDDLLDYITDGRFGLSLETNRESKAGKTLDTFIINIRDGLSYRSYKSYSGGEKFIIDFAIRMGLSILLSHRKGFNIETIIIDEGFESLDSRNQHLVLEAIQKTIKRYRLKKVILITHCEEITDLIQNRIRVVRKNNTSEVINEEKSKSRY